MNFVIHIVESPSGKDLLDRTVEGDALAESLRLMGVSSETYLVTSQQVLADAITRITESHGAGRRYAEHRPILHISCHGHERGIALTSGEQMNWETLGALIRPVGALLVGMSTCHGWHALSMAMTLEAPPFVLLVGPTRNVVWRESLVAFITLYHRFTQKIPATWDDFRALIDTVNDATGLPRGTFQVELGDSIRDNFRNALIEALRTQPIPALAGPAK